ncbi:MAG: glycoside hydrolase family 57 protein [Myxococcota bacterium]
MKTLHVAFMWHMHQPSYRNPVTGEVLLPWVRLHGVKDYTDMLAATRAVPAARVTVNWVPGLLDQCDALVSADYAGRERFWRLSEKPASELSPAEVAFLRQHFFSLSHENMLEPYPRYRELRDKVRAGVPLALGELRDLQVWFNLAWTGVTVRADPAIQRLVQKARDFEESDKPALFEAQRQAVLQLAARWRAAQDDGQVELTASPYYHPILPLLVDSDLARAADPTSPLPATRFRWRGDAEVQVARALASHERRFGQKARGMWPSEGSVAASVLGIMRQSGVDWIVTDESILAATLRGAAVAAGSPVRAPMRGNDKYRPWVLDGVKVFFRDHGLSDKIGFVYATWPADRAWADMQQSLLAIRKGLDEEEGDAVVVIALDGENCWEHYPGGITQFLPGLYRTIAGTPGLRLSTLSEAAQAVTPRPLPGLAPGSWIDGTFRTWLGDPVKNRAWELLTAARAAVQNPLGKLLAAEPGLAELLLRAEASDWWWWFGEPSSAFDMDFDALFAPTAGGVAGARQARPRRPPDQHLRAGARARTPSPPSPPRATSARRPSSRRASRWPQGLVLQVARRRRGAAKSFGSIHRAESLLARVVYGNDDQSLYLRLDAQDQAGLLRSRAGRSQRRARRRRGRAPAGAAVAGRGAGRGGARRGARGARAARRAGPHDAARAPARPPRGARPGRRAARALPGQRRARARAPVGAEAAAMNRGV